MNVSFEFLFYADLTSDSFSDVVSLCQRCPKLTELDLSDDPDLTSVTMEAIANSLLNLRNLSCSRCYKIDPVALA